MTWTTAAAAAAAYPGLEGGAGPAWWQTAGGLLAVFALLFVCLKLLARLNRRGGAGQASFLAVWPLGPRREIQVLRLADEVHYVYRHDGAMVLLRRESLDEWERTRAAEARRRGEEAAAPPVAGARGRLRLDALPELLRGGAGRAARRPCR